MYVNTSDQQGAVQGRRAARINVIERIPKKRTAEPSRLFCVITQTEVLHSSNGTQFPTSDIRHNYYNTPGVTWAVHSTHIMRPDHRTFIHRGSCTSHANDTARPSPAQQRLELLRDHQAAYRDDGHTSLQERVRRTMSAKHKEGEASGLCTAAWSGESGKRGQTRAREHDKRHRVARAVAAAHLVEKIVQVELILVRVDVHLDVVKRGRP